AAKSGEAIPEEILAAMPKLMREQVKRDRENPVAMAQRRTKPDTGAPIDASDGIPIFEDEDGTQPFLPDEPIALIGESTTLRRTQSQKKTGARGNPADADIDRSGCCGGAEPGGEPLASDEPPVQRDSVVRFRPPSIPVPGVRPMPQPPGAAPSQVARPNPIA